MNQSRGMLTRIGIIKNKQRRTAGTNARISHSARLAAPRAPDAGRPGYPDDDEETPLFRDEAGEPELIVCVPFIRESDIGASVGLDPEEYRAACVQWIAER